MRRKAIVAGSLLAALMAVPLSVRADALNIVNGGFEIGSVGDSSFTPIEGWSDTGTNAGFWLSEGVNDTESFNAAVPQSGALCLTGNREIGGAESQPTDSTLSQVINLSAENLTIIAGGGAVFNLSFYYHDEDGNDEGTVTVTFLNSYSNELASITTGVMGNGNYTLSEWTFVERSDWIDSETVAIRIDISTHRKVGTVSNLQFDSFAGSIEIPVPGEPGNRVYVDADSDSNTLAWNGSSYDYWSPVGGSNWTIRTASGNNEVIYQSGYTEDSVRLKTTVSGLPQGLYKVYAYFMAAGGSANWRVGASLKDDPAEELPLYYQSEISANTNLTAYYLGAIGAVAWGATPTPNPFYSTDLLSNPFGSDAVKLAEGDQRLVEVYLGVVSGTEISVYIDDDKSASSQLQRTWYDGIGYEPFTASVPGIINEYPEPGSSVINPDDFPLSIGAVITDSEDVRVNPASIELCLNGGENVIEEGAISQEGSSPETTTINHLASTLPDGTNTVELVYSTFNFPAVYTTSTWSFVVASRGEPGGRVYVDVNTTNTMAWGGAAYEVWDPVGGTNWTERTESGNGDQIYQSDYYADSVRLKTTVTDLPEGFYKVYAYFMAAGGSANWRIETALEDNPDGDLALYYQSDYPANTDLSVLYTDALDSIPWGDFSSPTPNPFFSTNLLTNPFGYQSVKLAQGDQRLIQVYLGTVSGTGFTVYVDDDVAADSQLYRTWYDGVGYESVTGASVNPDILSLSVSGGTATLVWESEEIGTYTIQHKSRLTGSWSDVKTGIAGGASTTTDSVSIDGGSQEFFQIKGE